MAFVAVLLIAAAVGGTAYVRASRLRAGGRLHSLPTYHAAYSLIWVLAPALLVLAAWAPMQTRLVNSAVLATPEGQALRESAKAVSAAMRCHSPLDGDELKSLHRTLTRLIDGLREATASAPGRD